MIDGILEIGKSILEKLDSEEEIAPALALDVPRERKGVKQHIVILKLKTSPLSLDFDFKEIRGDTAEKFLWLGNAFSNLPQDRLTSNKLSYLISQAVPNLAKKLPRGKLRQALEEIFKKSYFDLGDKNEIGAEDGQYERYRFLWDFEKLGYPSISTEEICSEAQKQKSASSAVKLATKKFMEAIHAKTGLTGKDVSLFTLEANGQILVQHPDYKSYLFQSLISEIFEKAEKGICYLCNNSKNVTWDTTRLKFKFYMTEKIGFASGLGEGKAFLRNYALCERCYKAIILAESFIRNHLESSLAKSRVYIIPSFQLQNVLSPRKLEKWSKEFVKGSFNAVKSLKGWQDFQNKLEEFQEYEALKNVFMLNFIFFKQRQAEFKILRLIQDIPPSRLDKLRDTSNRVRDRASLLLSEDDNWYLGLENMYYLFPVKRVRRGWGNKQVLEFYDSLFSGKPVSYFFLIKKFVDLIKVYRFEQFGQFNISRPDNLDIGLVYALLKANLLLLFLQKLNILRGRPVMEDKFELSDKAMEAFVKEMGYSKPQVGLFLLGYLIGEVGSAQYSPENKTKPILNKITYQGMNRGKIMRLTNDIFEKLKQYKKLPFNEKFSAEAKKFLDRNFENWPLSDQENVFYILSGYAYNTYKAVTGKKTKTEGGNSENNKQ